MGQNPWLTSSEEIPHILWNMQVDYCIHKRPTPIHILSQINPVHGSPSYFLNIQFNDTWVFHVVSVPQVSLSQPCMFLSCPPKPATLILLSLITCLSWGLVRRIEHKASCVWWGVQSIGRAPYVHVVYIWRVNHGKGMVQQQAMGTRRLSSKYS